MSESSWRAVGFAGWARGILVGEVFGTLASATTATIKKLTQTMTFRQPHQTQTYFAPSRLILSFWRGFGKRGTRAEMFASKCKRDGALQELVAQALLMPVRLHSFAALVFGNFCFSSFFKRAHSDVENCEC